MRFAVAALLILALASAAVATTAAADVTSGGGERAGTNIRLVDRLGPVVAGRSTLPSSGLTLDAGLLAVSSMPTPIVWLSLSAEALLEGGVRLGWTVTTDSDPVGFLVDRGMTADGPWTRLTETALTPARRDFVDPDAPDGVESWYRLTGVDRRGAIFVAGPIAVRPSSTPLRFALALPSPNPSTGGTALLLDLPSAVPVQLLVFDATGRLVAFPFDATLPGGHHELRWDGTGRAGPVGSGVYFLRLVAGQRREVRRVVIRK